MASLPDGADSVVLFRQLEEQLSEHKGELSDTRNLVFALDLEEADELNGLLTAVEESLFDRSLDMKSLLSRPQPASASSSHESKGVRLPKIEVPTFDGNLLHWTTFWEQFDVTIHSKSILTNAEKLAYLQHALKGGSARQTIKGLSRSGDQYAEAITCLKDRFNKPRMIHQAHVRAIVDAPPLKDGTGRELRRLHDVVSNTCRHSRLSGTSLLGLSSPRFSN